MLKGILNTNPSKRFKIDDIRRHSWFKIYQHEPFEEKVLHHEHQEAMVKEKKRKNFER